MGRVIEWAREFLAVPLKHPVNQHVCESRNWWSTEEEKSYSAQATSTQGSSSVGTNPAKFIENRCKCYTQLADLNNLKQSGLLSDAEYASELEAIMNTSKKLNN